MKAISRHRRPNKPIMEKKRRTRINDCLIQLKSLILNSMDAESKQYSKLEKADILEMTVNHLMKEQKYKVLQGSDNLTKYRVGFAECAQEVGRFLQEDADDIKPEVASKLLNHLTKVIGSTASIENHVQQHPQQHQQNVEGVLQPFTSMGSNSNVTTGSYNDSEYSASMSFGQEPTAVYSTVATVHNPPISFSTGTTLPTFAPEDKSLERLQESVNFVTETNVTSMVSNCRISEWFTVPQNTNKANQQFDPEISNTSEVYTAISPQMSTTEEALSFTSQETNTNWQAAYDCQSFQYPYLANLLTINGNCNIEKDIENISSNTVSSNFTIYHEAANCYDPSQHPVNDNAAPDNSGKEVKEDDANDSLGALPQRACTLKSYTTKALQENVNNDLQEHTDGEIVNKNKDSGKFLSKKALALRANGRNKVAEPKKKRLLSYIQNENVAMEIKRPVSTVTSVPAEEKNAYGGFFDLRSSGDVWRPW